MMRAPIGPTKPEAGVMVSRPATMPVTMPSTEGLRKRNHSQTIQVNATVLAPICVTIIAIPVVTVEAWTSNCSRRFGGATRDGKSAQISARFQKNAWRKQPADWCCLHETEVYTRLYV